MKVLGKMGNFAIQTHLFGILFYTEVWETADYAFDGCCCHIYWRFIPKCNFSFMELYSNPNQVILNIFMLLCLNVLDVTLKCLIFSYTTFMCSNIEKGCHFAKTTLKRWPFFILSLSVLPLPTSKRKKKCLNVQIVLIWKF